jgi:hypothetical protein
MTLWLIPSLNAALSLWFTVRSLQAKRLITIYWVLATYFGLLLLRDMWVAPIYYGAVAGEGLANATLNAAYISKIALSVFLSNLAFLTGEQLIFRLTARPGPTLPQMDRTSPAARYLLWFYLVLLVAGSVLYLPSELKSTYYESVNNVLPTWPKLIFQLSTPVLVIAALQRRYFICLAGAAAGMSVVLATHVREPVLLTVVPPVLLLIVKYSGKSKALVVGFAVLFLALATSLEYMRSNEFKPPEEFLPRGMYLISQLVDAGVAGTGNTSLEITAKALSFPFYNRLLTDDYNMPADSPTYVANIMMARPVVESGFRHYPFLWYTDVYLAAGRMGFCLGLVWGAIFGLWEGAMAGRVLVTAVFLPCFVRTIYLFYRGAGALVFHIVSRQLYFHLMVLLLTVLFTQWTQRRNRSSILKRAPLQGIRPRISAARLSSVSNRDFQFSAAERRESHHPAEVTRLKGRRAEIRYQRPDTWKRSTREII